MSLCHNDTQFCYCYYEHVYLKVQKQTDREVDRKTDREVERQTDVQRQGGGSLKDTLRMHSQSSHLLAADLKCSNTALHLSVQNNTWTMQFTGSLILKSSFTTNHIAPVSTDHISAAKATVEKVLAPITHILNITNKAAQHT